LTPPSLSVATLPWFVFAVISSLVVAWPFGILASYLLSVLPLLLQPASIFINSCTAIRLRRCPAGWGFGFTWHALFKAQLYSIMCLLLSSLDKMPWFHSASNHPCHHICN
jgi:hypothetical protein